MAKANLSDAKRAFWPEYHKSAYDIGLRLYPPLAFPPFLHFIFPFACPELSAFSSLPEREEERPNPHFLGSAGEMEMGDDYVYLALRDAMAYAGNKVNVLGIIVEHGLPKQTKGTDHVCTLKIMDPSYQERGLSVNMFINKMDKMPNIKSDGDIICLHRVMVRIFEGAAYAVFDKKYSNFALFGKEPGDSFNPYQFFSKIHITEHEKEYIRQLRIWLIDHQSDVGLFTYLVKLNEIKVGGFFDLICKILHVTEDLEGKWVIFVWDGTDVPPMSLQGNLDAEAQSPLPLHLEKSLLPRDVLCKFPCLGTVLRIFADKSCENLALRSCIGKWVKFRKIKFQSQFGLSHGLLTPSSRVSLMPENDSTVENCLGSYKERLSCNIEHLPMSCFPNPSPVTVTDYDDVASFSTLMDVLTYSKVTHKFKCVVRVVAILPWRAEDFRSPIGTHMYRIRLTLEDPTARIHAYVCAEDGEKFFEGYPSTEVLTHKMNKLLGITEGNSQEDCDGVSRSPPWVECCIKSYYLDKSNPWETRKYRIFGTTVVE